MRAYVETSILGEQVKFRFPELDDVNFSPNMYLTKKFFEEKYQEHIDVILFDTDDLIKIEGVIFDYDSESKSYIKIFKTW